jgi:hypothetical protein
MRVPVLLGLALLSTGFYTSLAILIYRPAWPYVAAASFPIAAFLLLRVCQPSEVS